MREKYFNRQEAEQLLPLIEAHLQLAREQKQKVDSLDEDISQAVTRIMFMGGSIPSYSAMAQKKAEREQLAGKLVESVNQIQQTGCLVKDLDMGLIDFPCLLEGEEVYLCWKLGEKRVAYWHRVDEGYAGRKPLDGPEPKDPPHQSRVQ